MCIIRCLVLLALHILRCCYVCASKSRQQIVDWSVVGSGWTQPEVTLDSLHLTLEDIITTSPDVDVNLESSATASNVVLAPRPFNTLTMPDPPGEIEKLRSDLDRVLKFTRDSQHDGMELESSHGATGLKHPSPSPSSGTSESIPLKSIYYQKATIFIPTLLLYVVMIPGACVLLHGGRALAHDHIPFMTTFGSYFIVFYIGSAILGAGILLPVACLLAAYGGYRISMKPLRWLRLGPRSIRKEPIGWVFEITCVCGVMSNLIYRVKWACMTALLGHTRVPLWIMSALPTLYKLHMIIASTAILLAMIFIVPTYLAQDFVFAFSSLYVIFSGVSFMHDLLVYNSIIATGLVQLDPTVFFVAEPEGYWNTGLYMTALCISSFYAAISINWKKTLPPTQAS